MRDSRGDAVIGVLVVLGFLIGAAAAGPIIDLGDEVANRIILYSAALTAGTYLWRSVGRRILRAVDVVLGLDQRVAAIEEHLGIKKKSQGSAASPSLPR